MVPHHSIIRRSIFVTAFFVAGHAIYYLLLAFGNRVLRPEVFGLFYTSLSVYNVIFTPGLVLTFVYAQHFAGFAARHGNNAIYNELRHVLAFSLRWGALFLAAVMAGLAALGSVVGIESFLIVVLIVAYCYAAFIFETARSALQALLRFLEYGVAWVFWNFAECVLAAIGFYWIGTVWAGLAGFLGGTLIATGVLLPILWRRRASAAPSMALKSPISMNSVIPFIIGYGLFTVLANIDVLLGYVLLSREQLGIYAASSMLPKAMATATLPVAQVAMPVIARQITSTAGARASIAKAVVICLGAGIAGWAALSLSSPLVCNSRIGLRFCQGGLLETLALAAAPLGALRVLVVSNMALGKRWRSLVQLAALALFLVLALTFAHDAERLAEQYLAACWGLMLLYLLIPLGEGALRGLLGRRGEGFAP
jgi:O-antigen/teichoic acid export membrane protein